MRREVSRVAKNGQIKACVAVPCCVIVKKTDDLPLRTPGNDCLEQQGGFATVSACTADHQWQHQTTPGDRVTRASRATNTAAIASTSRTTRTKRDISAGSRMVGRIARHAINLHVGPRGGGARFRYRVSGPE